MIETQKTTTLTSAGNMRMVAGYHRRNDEYVDEAQVAEESPWLYSSNSTDDRDYNRSNTLLGGPMKARYDEGASSCFLIPCCPDCRESFRLQQTRILQSFHSPQHQRQCCANITNNSSKTRKTRCYTICEVRRHNNANSAWIVAGDSIYDVTDYLPRHPGGVNSLLKRAGGVRDCTEDLKFHSKRGQKAWEQMKVGRLVPCDYDGIQQQRSPKSSPWWMWNWNQ